MFPVTSALKEMIYRLGQAKALDLGLAHFANLSKLYPDLEFRVPQMEAEMKNKIKTLDTSRKATTLEVHPISTFKNNPFALAFTSIRDLRARRLAEKFEHPDDATFGSTTSEGDENKPERGSEELLHRLMDAILLFFSEETDGQDWLRRFVTSVIALIPHSTICNLVSSAHRPRVACKFRFTGQSYPTPARETSYMSLTHYIVLRLTMVISISAALGKQQGAIASQSSPLFDMRSIKSVCLQTCS